MRLLPEDLGTKWHILLARNRALGVATVWTKPSEPQLGALGKRWIAGLPVSEEVAAATQPVTENRTKPWVAAGWAGGAVWTTALLAALSAHGLIDAGVIALLGAGYGYGTLYALPRRALAHLHQAAVGEDELEPFLSGNVPGLPHLFGQMASKMLRYLQSPDTPTAETQDPLERSFLLLARDVLRAQNIPANAQDEMRQAMRAIGEALYRLPQAGESASSVLAADQRGDSLTLHARAQREADPVVAASLLRQAEALEAAATASENGVVVARRVRALRAELKAQIEVLRAAIPGMGRPLPTNADSHAAQSEEALGRIADSVRRVATEAVAVTKAQDELDSFLGAGGSRVYDTGQPVEQQTLRR